MELRPIWIDQLFLLPSLENVADDLHDNTMVKLYKEKDPVRIIIMKEIYDFLEEITDTCEDVCLVIQDIVLKNA